MKYTLNIKKDPFVFDPGTETMKGYSMVDDPFGSPDVYEDEGMDFFPENEHDLELFDADVDQYLSTEIGSRSAPRLIKSEPQPIGQSFYVSIPLGGESPATPMTGIFIPEGYKIRQSMDLIVYLHGYRASMPVYRFWNREIFPYRAFREGVYNSGKNVILVVPTLGPKSQAGTLMRKGGFDSYLHSVLTAIAEYGPHKVKGQFLQVGNVVLACHSGGGSPMLQIALNKDTYTSRIKEFWGFDCLYSGRDKQTGNKYFTQPQQWIRWAGRNPDKKLFIYYLGSTETESRYLIRNARNSANIIIKRSGAKETTFKKVSASGHEMAPITHWGERLQQAKFLLDR